MVAIIYSGSQYAFWKVAYKGLIIEDFRTPGINPFFHDKKYIIGLLSKRTELINHAENIKHVYFFGAGASSKERCDVVNNAMKAFFKFARIHTYHDMDAAAMITCNNQPGLVSIIGSGSNAAYFNGKKIVENNFGLGYALGDEGSANWMGKELLRFFFNKTLPADLEKKFSKKHPVERKYALDRVYRDTQSVLYLSGFADFIQENIADSFCQDIVRRGFRKLLDLYILPLTHEYPGLPLYFSGQVAGIYQNYLQEVADEKQIVISAVIKEPVHKLLTYYINKN